MSDPNRRIPTESDGRMSAFSSTPILFKKKENSLILNNSWNVIKENSLIVLNNSWNAIKENSLIVFLSRDSISHLCNL